MRNLLPIIVVLVLMIACPAARADSLDERQRMDGLIQYYVNTHQFMGSVLVARSDKVLLNKGYGYANLEWKIPNTPLSKFRIASLTKQFTAACIFLLQDQGKLKIEDPVKQYIPDVPAAWDKITIYNLLTHTSGIPDYTQFPDSLSTNKALPTTPEKLIARFRDKPLDFPPGTKMSYSNSGYVLLGYLVERISGESYATFLQQHIFTPLGMKDTGYDSNNPLLEHRASGYSLGEHGLTNADFVDMTTPYAAGGLYSTTGDLLRWEQALFGGKLLSPASLQKMATPFLGDYACGLFVVKAGSRTLIRHSGGIDGFTTDLSYYPEAKVLVVVLANLHPFVPEDLSWRLAAVALGDKITLPSERKEIALPTDILANYTGVYTSLEKGQVGVVTLAGNQLLVQAGGGPSEALLPTSNTRFFLQRDDTEVEFARNRQGAVTGLVVQGHSMRNGVLQAQQFSMAKVCSLPATRQAATDPNPLRTATVRTLFATLGNSLESIEYLGEDSITTQGISRRGSKVVQVVEYRIKQSGKLRYVLVYFAEKDRIADFDIVED